MWAIHWLSNQLEGRVKRLSQMKIKSVLVQAHVRLVTETQLLNRNIVLTVPMGSYIIPIDLRIFGLIDA